MIPILDFNHSFKLVVALFHVLLPVMAGTYFLMTQIKCIPPKKRGYRGTNSDIAKEQDK